MIRPTGSCFDDALDFLESFAKQGAPPSFFAQFTVVHGICMTPTDQSEPFVHAWIEHEATQAAWQIGIIEGKRQSYAMSLEDFRATYRPLKTTRYTVEEALRENYRTGHYGPWVPEYAALCRKPGAEPGAEPRILGAAQVTVATKQSK